VFSGTVNSTEYAFGVVALSREWRFPESRCALQLVKPERVFGKKHVLHCILLTEKAFSTGKNVASSRSLELLLRLAGDRQIRRALRELRPKKRAALIVFGRGARKCYASALNALGARELKVTLEKPGEKDAMERAALVGA